MPGNGVREKADSGVKYLIYFSALFVIMFLSIGCAGISFSLSGREEYFTGKEVLK